VRFLHTTVMTCRQPHLISYPSGCVLWPAFGGILSSQFTLQAGHAMARFDTYRPVFMCCTSTSAVTAYIPCMALEQSC
jgi:hypothetical protein